MVLRQRAMIAPRRICDQWLTLLSILIFAYLPTTNALAVTNTNNATLLAKNIIGNGITFLNASYSGVLAAAGTYTAGPLNSGSGFILSTGIATDAVRPQLYLANTDNGGTNNTLCSQIVSGPTYDDAAVLSMYVSLDTTKYNGLSLNMVFSSEEYPQYVGST